MSLHAHVTALSSTTSARLTTAPAREVFASVFAWTEPAETDVGAGCVERGGQRWPILFLNHTCRKKKTEIRYSSTRSVIKGLFYVRDQTKMARASRLRAPIYGETVLHLYKADGRPTQTASNKVLKHPHQTPPPPRRHINGQLLQQQHKQSNALATATVSMQYVVLQTCRCCSASWNSTLKPVATTRHHAVPAPGK